LQTDRPLLCKNIEFRHRLFKLNLSMSEQEGLTFPIRVQSRVKMWWGDEREEITNKTANRVKLEWNTERNCIIHINRQTTWMNKMNGVSKVVKAGFMYGTYFLFPVHVWVFTFHAVVDFPLFLLCARSHTEKMYVLCIYALYPSLRFLQKVDVYSLVPA